MREVQCGHSPAVTWHPLETVNHVHMYTFPTTIHQNHFKQPAPFIRCSASQAQSLHLSVIGRWYLGFWLTHHFTQVQVSQHAGPFSFPDRGLCDESSPEYSVVSIIPKGFFPPMFTGLSKIHKVDSRVDT